MDALGLGRASGGLALGRGLYTHEEDVPYVVVVRSKGENGATAVYRGKSLPDIIRRMQHRFCRSCWHWPAADTFIRSHYQADMSAAEIAAALAHKSRKHITKNMVVHRARALGICASRRGRA